eukprot:6199868-Pleurochrysis_carterae.AAC.1
MPPPTYHFARFEVKLASPISTGYALEVPAGGSLYAFGVTESKLLLTILGHPPDDVGRGIIMLFVIDGTQLLGHSSFRQLEAA